MKTKVCRLGNRIMMHVVLHVKFFESTIIHRYDDGRIVQELTSKKYGTTRWLLNPKTGETKRLVRK